jgi:hypothetical protein
LLSPLAVQAAIEQELERLESLVVGLSVAYDADAEAEIAWKAKRAAVRIEARRNAEPGSRLPADYFEDVAQRDTADEYAAHLRARAKLQTLRESRTISESRLNALRTLSAGYRAVGA